METLLFLRLIIDVYSYLFTRRLQTKTQAKRKTLVGVENKLSALAEARSVKEDEMKGLERTLVQVLVEQQKKLLELLSQVGCT